MLKLGKQVNLTSESFRPSQEGIDHQFYPSMVLAFLVMIIGYITYRLAIVETLLTDATARYRSRLNQDILEIDALKQENEQLRKTIYDIQSNKEDIYEYENSLPLRPDVSSAALPAKEESSSGEDGFLVIG